MEKLSRSNREHETRDSEAREGTWRPPSLLPMPVPQDGYSFRWIRTSVFGADDNKNVSARFREGWTPVLAKDHPELEIRSDRNSTFPDNVEVGGLLLCKTSNANTEQRNAYYERKAANQIASVDNAFMRESDPRMPLLTPERRTRTTNFGSGE